MLIPFNSPCDGCPDVSIQWQEDEDIDNPDRWPTWRSLQKTVRCPLGVKCWFKTDYDIKTDCDSFIIESSLSSWSVADPPNSFIRHKDGYVSVVNMLDTVQRNYWRFRYLYWTLLARESGWWTLMARESGWGS